jgi:hypothetical protein
MAHDVTITGAAKPIITSIKLNPFPRGGDGLVPAMRRAVV